MLARMCLLLYVYLHIYISIDVYVCMHVFNFVCMQVYMKRDAMYVKHTSMSTCPHMW